MGFDTAVTGRIGGRGVQAGNALWTPFAENGLEGTLLNNIHGGYSDINPSACSTLNNGKQITETAAAEFAISQGAIHNTTVPLATVGGDVCWIAAPEEYPHYEQAINYTRAHAGLGVDAHFSSPDRWAAALYAANEPYPVMASADEFPYGCV